MFYGPVFFHNFVPFISKLFSCPPTSFQHLFCPASYVGTILYITGTVLQSVLHPTFLHTILLYCNFLSDILLSCVFLSCIHPVLLLPIPVPILTKRCVPEKKLRLFPKLKIKFKKFQMAKVKKVLGQVRPC